MTDQDSVDAGRRDCLHPRARHVHGTRLAYLMDECRCFGCRIANSRTLARKRAGGTVAEHAWATPAGIQRRLEALHTIGWTAVALAHQLGVTPQAIRQLREYPRARSYAYTLAAVTALYDDLWDKPALGEQADRARARAKSNGWMPPLAWDDDTIDDPAAIPSTPSNGARDIAPCGTPAAYRRHRRHGEQADEACLRAERRRNAGRSAAA